MSDPAQRFRPDLIPLESRDVPSGFTESFEQTLPPALPANWTSWSGNAAGGYLTTRLTAGTGVTSLAATGNTQTQSRFWHTTAQPGDTAVAARIRSDGPAPTQVLVRGVNLNSASPSYLAAVVAPGAQSVKLVEVVNGTERMLATVFGQSLVYGAWLTVTVTPIGASATVQVQRGDTGQYLSPQGNWIPQPVDALRADVTHRPANGFVGVGRAAGGQGMAFVDDIAVSPPTVEVRESFDSLAASNLPANWREWTSDGSAGFDVSNQRALSPTNGLGVEGSSVTAARAWFGTAQPADVQASVAYFADSLLPGSLIVRGANLDTARPTYYALTATRGADVKLIRVVDGTQTVLASLRSSAYTSGVWLRLTLTANGDQLRAVVFRDDRGEWLSSDGTWSDSPQPALEATDTAIRASGFVGLGRSALAAGRITFDDFSAVPASQTTGPNVSVTTTPSGTTFTGDVTFHAASATARRIEFRLNGQLRAAFAMAPANWTLDTTLLVNGSHEVVVRAVDQVGNIGSATVRFTVSNPNPNPPPTRPTIVRHYSHVRVAQLAYYGNPMGSFEQARLRDSVDLVIPNPRYLQTINTVAPATPQAIYSNLSNLYEGLLTDWLAYADRTNADRELAFYHVTRATPFSGGSASSQAVTKFWGVSRGSTNLTGAAFGGTGGVTFGAVGEAVAIGYPDRFRELNVTLNRGAASGWTGVYEYVSAVDANGMPTAWKALPLLGDGTSGLTRNGQVTFDPPRDWVAAKVNGSASLFYIRVRTLTGNSTNAPNASKLLGRDYVNARGTNQGTIPAFDSAADRDGDGYLNATEYASRTPGKDARFEYESRLFYPYYGQMRFVTNPSSSALRHWAADYHTRLLAQSPLADGLFLDNSGGRLPFAGTPVVESVTTYTEDAASLVSAVWRAVAPKMVFTNTAGGFVEGDAIARNSTGIVEEFLLRPVEATWSSVEDVANLVERRLNSDTPAPYVVLDSHPGTLPTTDNRVRTGTLAYYYLLADPDHTMLMFFGGYSPATAWSQTWVPAISTNVGAPTSEMTTFATGTDPENRALTYKVFARNYANALVLYKPRSYAPGVGTGTLTTATGTTHELGGNYRVLNGDGSLGSVVTRITLRNGEGAVLMRA